MICTICGKIVRDMRKHKLVHSGEKPFQCDRCSYRCSRSGTLKRHMATHLNSDPMKMNPVINAPTAGGSSAAPTPTPDQGMENDGIQTHPPPTLTMQPEQSHLELQAASALEQQIPIHIPHHEATQLQEPKYIELTTQQLAQHLPPHSTYNSPPTVAYREFKFP